MRLSGRSRSGGTCGRGRRWWMGMVMWYTGYETGTLGGARTLGVLFGVGRRAGILCVCLWDGSTLVYSSLRRSFNACLIPFHDLLLSS